MNFNSTTFVVSTLRIGRLAKVYAHKGGREAEWLVGIDIGMMGGELRD